MGGTEEGVPSEAQRESQKERDASGAQKEGAPRERGHTEKGRRREQGATSRQCAPSFLRPCEGHVVQWKREDEELNQGNPEKGGPKRKSGKICSTSARVDPPQVGLTLAHAQLQTSVPIFPPPERSGSSSYGHPLSRLRLTPWLTDHGEKDFRKVGSFRESGKHRWPSLGPRRPRHGEHLRVAEREQAFT